MKGMETKLLTFSFLILVLSSSCNVNEPVLNSDGIFIEVTNGTLTSEGSFRIFNNSNKSVFITYNQYPVCSFFTYSIEEKINTAWQKLTYDEINEKWVQSIYNPDSIYVVCDIYMSPIELKQFQSFEQIITGIDRIGEFRLTIHYTPDKNLPPPYNKLNAIYRVE
jgi:hypothetical protein